MLLNRSLKSHKRIGVRSFLMLKPHRPSLSKQDLRIKTFYGTSENAVKAQIWIAVSVYVLVAIMKKRLKIEASLYTILQVLSVTIFERMPLIQVLTESVYENETNNNDNQLFLFN